MHAALSTRRHAVLALAATLALAACGGGYDDQPAAASGECKWRLKPSARHSLASKKHRRV
jgi:ABC-type glycerol-3-phosphate transport system substrate-binding protein